MLRRQDDVAVHARTHGRAAGGDDWSQVLVAGWLRGRD